MRLLRTVFSRGPRTRSPRACVALPALARLRRFEFWSEEGRHLRTSAVDAPVGFFASSPDEQLFLGLRDDPADELVVFSWSWGAILTGG